MRRRDVFRLRPGRQLGHEQSGVRHGVIVPSDALMRRSTVRIAPTSTAARAASFQPEIELGATAKRARRTGRRDRRDQTGRRVWASLSRSAVWHRPRPPDRARPAGGNAHWSRLGRPWCLGLVERDATGSARGRRGRTRGTGGRAELAATASAAPHRGGFLRGADSSRSTRRASADEMRPTSAGESRCRYQRVRALVGTAMIARFRATPSSASRAKRSTSTGFCPTTDRY